MSDVAIAVSKYGDEAGPPTPPRTHYLLNRVRWVGYVLLGAQLAGFLVWSAVLYSRFSDTSDFALYNQAWFLTAHGLLDPFSTVTVGFGSGINPFTTFSSVAGLHYWQNDAEFMPLILSPFYWVIRSGVGLPWLQDISIVGAEAVALTWICDMARTRCRPREASLLASFGLLLLIINPWTWWAVSFDVHTEPLTVGLAALLAWDMAKGRRRAWVWAPLVLLASAPCATYVIGIGLGGTLKSRRLRCQGTAMALVGVAYLLFIVLIHGDVSVSLPRTYGQLVTADGHLPANLTLTGLLVGIATHPFNILQALWSKHVDILANLTSSGLLGIGEASLIPLMLLVLLANSLIPGIGFTEPLFQSIPIYVLLPVGTVGFIIWLLPRHRRVSFALVGLIAAQAVGWAAVWGPQTSGQWLRISPAQAATLASVQAKIPASAEVVASQGVVGRFSSRARVYNIFGEGYIPVGPDTWFIITPNAGIETVNPASMMALIGELAGPYHATLIAHANGVWAFRWTPPPGIHGVQVPRGSSPLPAWAGAGATGRQVLDGPPSGWHMAASGTKGYVVDGIEWRESPGRYLANVTISSSAPVNVEVWDNNTNTLLARQTIARTDGIQQVELPLTVPPAPDASTFSGWGPFRANFVAPSAGQRIEVRVWSPGGVAVNVYSGDLNTASGAPVPASAVPGHS